MTEILNEIFEELYAMDLVSDHCEFSEKWLLKSRRYMSMIRASGREPSVSSIACLAATMKKRHHYYETNKFDFLREKADMLAPSLRRCWTALYERSLEK